MAELEYRNRSISQLVSELNHLGQPNVVVAPLRLLALHDRDLPSLKRFKNSQGDQFFMISGNQKKYSYTEVVASLNTAQLGSLEELFERGFSVSIVFTVPKEQEKLTQLLSQIVRIVKDSACAAISFNQQAISSCITGNKINQREIQGRLKYYSVNAAHLLAFLDRMVRVQGKGIGVIKVRSMREGQTGSNEINLVTLPQEFFSPSLKTGDFLASFKSQIGQILNYLKLNPSNKYQHFSKLLTKRLPVTNMLAGLILEQTATLVINWVGEGSPGIVSERLSFYDRMKDLSPLLKKVQTNSPSLSQLPTIYTPLQPKKAANYIPNSDRTPIAAFEDQSQLDYCRSLQRKTHKYSINQKELFDEKIDTPFDSSLEKASNTPSPVTHFPPCDPQYELQEQKISALKFDQTIPRKPQCQNLRQSEEIAILKANHAVQISQYHQTIQQLNRKILVLVNDRGIEELYGIHQRELALMELKIKELRGDIQRLTSSPDDKGYKAVIRKLNDQIKRLQAKASEQKVSAARIAVIQKQLTDATRKCEQAQQARKKLTFEIEHLTKRLKICDSQIELLNGKETRIESQKNNRENNLSLSDNQILKEVQVLVRSVQEGNGQSKGFLMRKITNLMEDLASSRELLLQCNDFLVQLEQHLEQQLGTKEPQIVLDCNKFIRNFLMDNMNIF